MDRIQSRRIIRIILPYAALWAALTAALIAFASYETANSRQHAVAASEARIGHVSRLLREHAVESINGADRVLAALQLIHQRRLIQEPVRALLPAFYAGDSEPPRLAIFDAEGRLLASTGPAANAAELSMAGRAEFVAAREQSADATPTIGATSGSTTNPADGSIRLVRRLTRPDGAFDGVLVADLAPAAMLDVQSDAPPSAASMFGLLGRDGLVNIKGAMLSSPAKERALERALHASLPGTQPSPTGAATLARLTVDGAPMLVAFQAVPGTALVTFTALDEAEALASHTRFARKLLGFTALALAALSLPLLLVGRRAVRELHHRRDLEVRYEKERRRARSDPLTGAANRVAFDDHLERCNKALAEDGTPFVLAFIDIDRFKLLNDTQGHAAGDNALRRVARTLAGAVRATDLVARMGGDEFAVLMPGATAEGSPRVCGKLHAALLAAAASADLPIGFSIGVVAFEQAPAEPRVVTALADRLMYDVKSAGGEGVRYGVYRRDGLHLANEVPA